MVATQKGVGMLHYLLQTYDIWKLLLQYWSQLLNMETIKLSSYKKKMIPTMIILQMILIHLVRRGTFQLHLDWSCAKKDIYYANSMKTTNEKSRQKDVKTQFVLVLWFLHGTCTFTLVQLLCFYKYCTVSFSSCSVKCTP